MPSLRVIRTQGEVLVVVCDAELIGRELTEGKLRLKINESFYRSEEKSVEECLAALREATVANLVGSIVEHAIKANMIKPENVLRIQNVAHAQLVRL